MVTVTSIAPATGSALGYIPVVITGTGFTGATAVTFGTTPADTYVVDSDTQITASLPPHAAGLVDVIVTAPAGTGTKSNAFAYLAPTDLEAMIERMAEIANAEKTVTGIAFAYPNNPASLTVLPAVCYFVGPQNYEPYRDSEDVKIEKTTVYIRVHVDHVTQGIPGEVESRVKRIAPLIRDSILAHPGLQGLEFIQRVNLESSSGVKVLNYAGENFAGCEWKTTIERYIKVNYGSGE